MENCRDPDSIRITWDATELGVTPELGDTIDGGAGSGQTVDQSLDLAALDPRTGQSVYERACGICHAEGVAGAPRTDDAAAWKSRVAQGMTVLVEHAINGYRGEAGYMPPRGGNNQLSDAEVAAAVAYMLDRQDLPDDG
jgi:cytochrome c5